MPKRRLSDLHKPKTIMAGGQEYRELRAGEAVKIRDLLMRAGDDLIRQQLIDHFGIVEYNASLWISSSAQEMGGIRPTWIAFDELQPVPIPAEDVVAAIAGIAAIHQETSC